MTYDSSASNLPGTPSVADVVFDIPADWGQSNGTFGINSSSSISFTAPATASTYQYTVMYTPKAGFVCADTTGSCLTSAGSFTINLTVTSSTPPSMNHPPTDPGAPHLDSGSLTPNNTGLYTVDWAPSTDQDADAISYTLEERDANDTSWSTVATGLTTNSYTFSTAHAEGSWKYRVTAVDSHGATSNAVADAAPIVVVDLTAPYAPVVTSPTAADYTAAGNDWFKDSVTVTFAKDTSTTANGDPVLADGSDGSGVSSITSPVTYNSSNVNATTGAFSLTGTATDAAANVSDGTTVTGFVDWQAPTVSCPNTVPTVFLNDPNATLGWTASDPAPSAGLSTASSGTVQLDTSAVGTHQAVIPAGTAQDNVGHSSSAVNCDYKVDYVWNGFLQPINDTAHYVGETTSIFKAGSTVPVKFQLTDALGNVVQSASAPVWLLPTKGGPLPSTATVDETQYLSTATAGGTFRWDSTARQYIYNWNTAKSQAGSYWQIGVLLSDGSTHYVSIGLK